MDCPNTPENPKKAFQVFGKECERSQGKSAKEKAKWECEHGKLNWLRIEVFISLQFHQFLINSNGFLLILCLEPGRPDLLIVHLDLLLGF
jgi:hypothetical protein